MQDQLNQSTLREWLYYEPETGIFTRIKVSSRTRAQVGDKKFTINRHGQLVVSLLGKTRLLQRLAWLYVYGANPTGRIDHINGIATDNRICNLREVSYSEDQQNLFRAKCNNKSGYLGVRKRKNGKWTAEIRLDGVSKHLGVFDDPKVAHDAYLKAKAELHPFATLAAAQ